MRAFLLAALCVSAASAQPSNWDLPGAGASVTLAADRPFFTDGNPFEGVTSAWTVSTRHPVGPGLRLVADLPFAFADTRASSETFSVLGNLQLGAELDLAGAPVTFGGYLRLPTASGADDDGPAQFVGLFTEYEQIGAFLEDVATVSVLSEGRFSPASTPALTLRLRAVPQVLIPTGDSDDFFSVADPEVYVGLAAHAIYDADQILVSGGLSTLTLLTEERDDRTEVFAGASAEVAVGRVRPGLTVRAPFSDGLSDVLSSVVGLRLTVGL